MEKFVNILVVNFRKIILPIIILAVGTVAVQMVVYGFTLRDNYGYEYYEMVDPTMDTVIAQYPIPFMSDKSMECWNNIGLASLIIAIALIIFLGKEKDNSISILRNLPVRRSTLWIAKFIQVSTSILLIYLANYCAMYLQYLYYEKTVHEKFRELFTFAWDNNQLRTFFIELAVFMVVAVIITILYYVKNYSVKTGKGGTQNEEN